MKGILFTCIIHFYSCVANRNYLNQYEILIKQGYFYDVKSQLEGYGFTYFQQIAGVSIFEGNDEYNVRSSKENVAELKQILTDKVLDITQAFYIDPDLPSVLGQFYETEGAEDSEEMGGRLFGDSVDGYDRNMFLTCSPYYDSGHGIDAVWKNFDGYNVTVAVVDIGVSVNHDELRTQIRIAHNFETNDEDVEPEDYGIQYGLLTNHGNSAASVIGAVKDNTLCSAGVAYNASIAGKLTLNCQTFQN
ncbi:FURIN-like protein [Mya arenaria]|uniref:FURIN-like protein n=1 Tax=Mya arenaria TaxID=6604 RepID=A0ABY7ER92_MYAAR|nr:FURIN-like protein [Mya arenaria]